MFILYGMIFYEIKKSYIYEKTQRCLFENNIVQYSQERKKVYITLTEHTHFGGKKWVVRCALTPEQNIEGTPNLF